MPDLTDEDEPHLGEYPGGLALLAQGIVAARDMAAAEARLREVIEGASADTVAVVARIASAGEQPETQLAVDLIAAEATIARVRAEVDRWPPDCWSGLRGIRAALDGA